MKKIHIYPNVRDEKFNANVARFLRELADKIESEASNVEGFKMEKFPREIEPENNFRAFQPTNKRKLTLEYFDPANDEK